MKIMTTINRFISWLDEEPAYLFDEESFDKVFTRKGQKMCDLDLNKPCEIFVLFNGKRQWVPTVGPIMIRSTGQFGCYAAPYGKSEEHYWVSRENIRNIKKEPRYYVDNRRGYVAVCDRTKFDPNSKEGLSSNAEGVIKFWVKSSMYDAVQLECANKLAAAFNLIEEEMRS